MITLLAQVFGVAVVGAARPATTFFLVQLVVGIAHRLGAIELPAEMRWSVSLVALGFGLSAMLLEVVAQHTDEVEGLLREFHLDKLFGGLSSGASGALIFTAYTVGDEAHREDLAEAVRIIAEANLPPWQQTTIVLAAVALNLALVWVRSQILSWLEQLDLKNWWAWLETGGVGVTLVVLWFLPALTLVLLVLTVMLLGLGVFFGKAAAWSLDRTRRLACSSCSHAVRFEALGCPACGATLTPHKFLGRLPKHPRSAPA